MGRLLFAIDQFRMFGAIPAVIIPATTSVFAMLCCTAYFFASFGMLLIGGFITRDPSNPTSELLEPTGFMDSRYLANNHCNDMFSSLNVLFNHGSKQVDNKGIRRKMPLETSGWSGSLSFLFTSWELCISNEPISIILNGFFHQLKKIKDRAVQDGNIEGEEVLLTRSQAIFYPSHMTGRETGLQNCVYYSIRVKPMHKVAPFEVCEREMLRKLFSQESRSSTSSNYANRIDTLSALSEHQPSVRVKPMHNVTPSEVCEREILRQLFSQRSRSTSNNAD